MKLPKILWPWTEEAKEFAEYKHLQEKRKQEYSYGEVAINAPAGDQDQTYLFDFLNWSASYGGYYHRSINDADRGGNFPPVLGSEIPNKNPIVRVKPIDVVDSLYCPPRNFLDVSLIDQKIEMFKIKEGLVHNNYSKDEVTGFIERLELRKKYNEYKSYFEGFQVTTDEKIGELLDNHKDLARKPVELFIPDFPKDAIDLMVEYTAKVEELSGKKPIYYVIAEADQFRKAYDKRDPILLAQSPFGFYWYILGAWDKEMMLLSEL